MKTTIVLDDALYGSLVSASVRRYGNAKSISKTVADALRAFLSSEQTPETMFGCMPKMRYAGMRDKSDRI